VTGLRHDGRRFYTGQKNDYLTGVGIMMNVALYRAVKPAAKLMDKLRFPHKLILMAAVILGPMLLISWLLASALTTNIRATAQELRGAAALGSLARLQMRVQDHRGATSLRLRGRDGNAADPAVLAKAVDAEIAAVDGWRTGPGRSFPQLDGRWTAITGAWNALKSQGADADAARSFDEHSRLIKQIADYIAALADASDLTLDSAMTSFALQDLVTAKAPAAMQRIGFLRNYAATHLVTGEALPPLELGQLMAYESALDSAFEPVVTVLQRALAADPQLAAALNSKLSAAVAAEAALRTLIDDRIVHAPVVQTDAVAVFQAGQAAKEALQALDEAAIPLLEHSLQQRMATATEQRRLTVIACLVAAAAAFYLFLGFIRSLNATLRGLRRAAARMTCNDFPEEIELFSRDEMQEIAREMEKIARAFRSYNDAQRQQLTEAVKHSTAMHSASVGLMIADMNGTIEYVNPSAVNMFSNATDMVRALDPDFDASRLVGRSFDMFHRNPEQQKHRLNTLTQPLKTRVRIGMGSFDITVTPIFGADGERLGAVAEWVDRTAQEAMDRRIADIVKSAAAGDFTIRVDVDGLDENFRVRAENLNRLIAAVETGLNELERVMAAVAEGDLTRTTALALGGQFGKLGAHTNATIGRLSDIVGQIKRAADGVGTAAREIAAGNGELSQRTEQQAAHIEETASSMEQLTGTVSRNADSAQQADQLARGASDVAMKGGDLVAQVVSNMSAIEAASHKVADIVAVIDGIAFQTNILALNAAVEAARAGEQGRGFAVVAGEVRSLAQRAGAAAKEIKELITDSVAKVEQGSVLVDSAGHTMQEIVTAIKRVTDIMGEISAASREQSAGIDSVNSAVAQMDESTQQNAALVEQAAASARSLEEQAASLGASVSVFRLAGSEPAQRGSDGGVRGQGASARDALARPGSNPGSNPTSKPTPNPTSTSTSKPTSRTTAASTPAPVSKRAPALRAGAVPPAAAATRKSHDAPAKTKTAPSPGRKDAATLAPLRPGRPALPVANADPDTWQEF
jgi:methyl-accepting chemotaxis protein